MSPIDPYVVIRIGPPPDGWERELFDQFQACRGRPSSPPTKDWAQYERELIDALFSSDPDEPTPMDQIMTEVLDTSVRMSPPYITFGNDKGLYIVTSESPDLSDRATLIIRDLDTIE